MAEDMTEETKKSPPPPKSGSAAVAAAVAAEEHYEEVAEYRIGEGAPPIFLVLCFIFIVLWACFSWIPFFGY